MFFDEVEISCNRLPVLLDQQLFASLLLVNCLEANFHDACAQTWGGMVRGKQDVGVGCNYRHLLWIRWAQGLSVKAAVLRTHYVNESLHQGKDLVRSALNDNGFKLELGPKLLHGHSKSLEHLVAASQDGQFGLVAATRGSENWRREALTSRGQSRDRP